VRTSIFIETDVKLIEAAAKTGVDRIEFYTVLMLNILKKTDLPQLHPISLHLKLLINAN
jgi:pyridoxine 5'-phosphate synthase PdxJ